MDIWWWWYIYIWHHVQRIPPRTKPPAASLNTWVPWPNSVTSAQKDTGQAPVPFGLRSLLEAVARVGISGMELFLFPAIAAATSGEAWTLWWTQWNPSQKYPDLSLSTSQCSWRAIQLNGPAWARLAARNCCRGTQNNPTKTLQFENTMGFVLRNQIYHDSTQERSTAYTLIDSYK